MLAMKDIK